MNYFERMLLLEELQDPIFQPINLRNPEIKNKRDKLIKEIVNGDILERNESTKKRDMPGEKSQ